MSLLQIGDKHGRYAYKLKRHSILNRTFLYKEACSRIKFKTNMLSHGGVYFIYTSAAIL